MYVSGSALLSVTPNIGHVSDTEDSCVSMATRDRVYVFQLLWSGEIQFCGLEQSPQLEDEKFFKPFVYILHCCYYDTCYS